MLQFECLSVTEGSGHGGYMKDGRSRRFEL